MKIKLINEKLVTFRDFCSFIYQSMDKKTINIILVFLLFLFLVTVYFAQEFHQSIKGIDLLIVLILILSPLILAPFFWGIYYCSSKEKEIEFFDCYFICGNRKVDYHSVKFFLKQRESNFSINFYGFPFSYMFVGYSDDVLEKIRQIVSKVHSVPIKIK